ncbi:C2 domain-containing protein/PLDc domain-containing protein/PLD_C domain-containing protein [Cephalotus follicularis]|uniref:Phospholipase D n=1 Tax=Cephalotus follicularis TaxID=3775 RepID=A0A1Q3CED1_CEPFO|nr:C2 domain-containing protein/PLDc domain-containing protein/PLD_C domain-containing protein [Cephalotus follicularis]
MAEVNSDQPVILHGDLDLTIIEARGLPNMDLLSQHLRSCLTCEPCKTTSPPSVSGDSDRDGDDRRIHHHRKIITSDPYVTVCVPQTTVARTRVIKNSQRPRWNEHFDIPLAHPATHLEFQVKDDDIFGAELMGVARIPAGEIANGEHISGWFPILDSSGKPPKQESALRLDLKFTPFEQNPLYQHGFAGDPDHGGVRGTYFPLRKGCHVTLYQDAHVPDGLLPPVELEGGKIYKQEKCWEDICYAISEAHHLIYIVGWSIYPKIKLVREPTRPLPRGGDLTLGELLKYKSEEGVRVLLLVWDDKTSRSDMLVQTQGLMQTHDEETKKFFKHSSVNCVLAPRYASSKLGVIKQQLVGTMFTHHQKCVLVDTQAAGNDRKITAFLGGIDLCDGRYDTPEHRLFRDLDTIFQDDFHNPTFPSGMKAPRQPWHDLHCKVDGPAAYDVLINFEQRWRKATKWREFNLSFKRKSHWHDDSLIKIERISWIRSPPMSVSKDDTTVIPNDDPTVWVCSEDDPETWHAQLFRSIDSGSLKGFPKDVDQAEAQNLVCAKDQVIDKSIQTAYVQVIRSAQHFIYIENQYFIGSSYAWPSYKNAGADNLIPMELALKIASKIKAKERFAVYIVIPMWPEGDPKSGAMQEILYWQHETMHMMYDIVVRELKMQHVDADPRDYLNFYCLGNREEIPKEMSTNGDMVSEAYKFQRFMIYVHAKGMIVDDEYVIVGSANINQRSMAGTKDTELAMGMYQPHYTWAKKKRHPHGQIYRFRMSLWAEHLGELVECFQEPESLECVNRVNEIAEDNWTRYTAAEFTPLHGHLLKYPVQVDADGKVGPLPGYENFPDAGGKIVGSHSTTIPDILTT